MTTRIPMVKHFGALRSAGPDAEDILSNIPNGAQVMVEIKRPRNIKHHRMWWALCQLIADNSERYKSAEDVSDMLKVGGGHCKRFEISDGRVVYVPKSISFASMDQTAFSGLWERVIAYVCSHVIRGLDESDIKREVEEICGLRNAA